MKKLFIFLLLAGSLQPVLAQNPNYEKASQEAISQLSPMLGTWKGESWHITKTGEKIGPTVVEYHTTTKMNGNLIMIETKGTDPKLGNFESLAIISYNVPEKAYKMSGYTAGGDQVYYFKVLEPNKKIEYGYEVKNQGKVRIRLTINDDGKTAVQVGEYSTDGQKWIKFREENMTKI